MAFKKLSIASGKASGTNINMPLLVIPSEITNLGTLTLAEAQSSRFYSDEAKTTELAREIVSADEIHVKVPSVTTSTTIYIDYDGVRSDYATDATYGTENVWSDYAYVSHDGGLTDSTGNGGDGTAFGTPTIVTGKIGNGTLINADSEGYEIADNTAMQLQFPITISYWINATVFGHAFYTDSWGVDCDW